jgi:hypothetical protein
MTLHLTRKVLLACSVLCAHPLLAQNDEDFFTLEPDIICRRLGSPQDSLCPKLEHLRLRFNFAWDPNVRFRLAYDPQQPPKITWWNTYHLGLRKLPPRQSWLHDYAIRVLLSPSWDLSLEDWSGATLLPDASGLGFAYALQDSSWNQTVLRLTWLNPDLHVLAASVIVGLGEGERLKERDNIPYLAGLARVALFEGAFLQLGVSYDADSLSPDQLFWMNRDTRQAAARGFAASRRAVALVLDGQHPSTRGLRLSLGWQKNRITASGVAEGIRALGPEEGPFDPSEILAESLGGKGPTDRQAWSFSASYQILAEYILAAQWQRLTVDPGRALLQSCLWLDNTGRCLDSGQATSQLSVDGRTFGLGWRSDEGTSFMLESFLQRYDKLYEFYHFAPGVDRRQDSLQVLQFRLRWQL